MSEREQKKLEEMRKKDEQEAERKREREEKREKEKADRKAEQDRIKVENAEKAKNTRDMTRKIQLIQPHLSKLDALLEHAQIGKVPKANVTDCKKSQKELDEIKKACERYITGTTPSAKDKEKIDKAESAVNEAKTCLAALNDFIQAAERHSK